MPKVTHAHGATNKDTGEVPVDAPASDLTVPHEPAPTPPPAPKRRR